MDPRRKEEHFAKIVASLLEKCSKIDNNGINFQKFRLRQALNLDLYMQNSSNLVLRAAADPSKNFLLDPCLIDKQSV